MHSKKAELPYIIFADGASSGNPGPSGWGAILASPTGQVLELGGRQSSSTNNRMELTAVLRALEHIKRDETIPIQIYTDSTYVIRGITQWIWNWKRNGWKTAEGNEVVNADIWQDLSNATLGKKIQWCHVRGHSGIPGNERVDEIAVAFSRGTHPALFHGPLLRYDIPIHDLPESTSLPPMRPKNQKSAPAYSYLSLVNHSPKRHTTWAECEARVKGRSGAKFKKALSQEEETSILRSWGFSQKDLI